MGYSGTSLCYSYRIQSRKSNVTALESMLNYVIIAVTDFTGRESTSPIPLRSQLPTMSYYLPKLHHSSLTHQNFPMAKGLITDQLLHPRGHACGHWRPNPFARALFALPIVPVYWQPILKHASRVTSSFTTESSGPFIGSRYQSIWGPVRFVARRMRKRGDCSQQTSSTRYK